MTNTLCYIGLINGKQIFDGLTQSNAEATLDQRQFVNKYSFLPNSSKSAISIKFCSAAPFFKGRTSSEVLIWQGILDVGVYSHFSLSNYYPTVVFFSYPLYFNTLLYWSKFCES